MQVIQKVKMFFPHRFRIPRPAPPPDPEWDVLLAPPPSVIVAKIRGLRGTFANSPGDHRLGMFRHMCVMAVRHTQACLESNKRQPATFPPGEDSLSLVAQARALGQLYTRVHLRHTEWWRDLEWLAAHVASGIQVAIRNGALRSNLDASPHPPPPGPWSFDITLPDAIGLPGFGPASSRRCGIAPSVSVRLLGAV